MKKSYRLGEDYYLSDLPPSNYDTLKKHFPEADFHTKGTIYTYGKTIHTRQPFPEHTLVHEMVHVKQQMRISPGLWWFLYLHSKSFRYRQELEAYRAEYAFIKKTEKAFKHETYLKYLAKYFSLLYGFNVSLSRALILIENNV